MSEMVPGRLPERITGNVRRWRAWWLTDDAEPSRVTVRVVGFVRSVVTSGLLSAVVPVLFVLACAAIQLVQRTGPIADHLAAGLVVSVLLTVPLLVRRRYPVTVFAVIAVVALVQWSFDLRLVADMSLLIALYTVASVYPARMAWAAAAVVEVGSLLAVLRWQPVDGRVDSLVLLTGPTVAAVCAGMAVRSRRVAIATAAEDAQRRERERHQQEMIGAARNRERIAREMHDVVAHGLSVMVTLTEGALAKQDSDPAVARAAMTRVADTGRSSLAEMRDLVGILRGDDDPPHRPQPGIGELDSLVRETRATGVDVEVVTDGVVTALGDAVSLSVYRIVQEALTNVRKHSEASRVRVELSYRPDEIVVEVLDDGGGSDRARGSGHGLAGIAERAALHGGQAHAGPVDGGWRVWARVPTGGPVR
ncbi:sensor histidine kinase [Gordonia sp. DT30]|uniref:sensor histidine kinase n=1 Tax=Gordonia sp. DT30 TaxID=3416546 RepID=UPI003CEEF9D6